MHIAEYARDHDTEALNRIRELGLPVVLYGSARMADLEERTLKMNQIPVACRVVDDTPPADGKPGNVTAASSVDDTLPAYVLVLANGRAIAQAMEPGGTDRLRARFTNAAYVCYLNGIYGFDLISARFCRDHQADLNWLYESLEDDKSKQSLEAYLNSQINRDRTFLLPHVEAPQYFSVGPMKLRDDEIFVDCGAYDGDTIRDFLRVVDRRYRRIVALEPDAASAAALGAYLAANHVERTDILRVGAYDCKTALRFVSSGDNSAVAEEGDVFIKTDTIDAVTHREATSIKMDIEGSEMKALAGAEGTIRACKPNLMICVYHKPAHLIEIPSFIRALVPEYRFYFRVHKPALVDAVLYATVR